VLCRRGEASSSGLPHTQPSAVPHLVKASRQRGGNSEPRILHRTKRVWSIFSRSAIMTWLCGFSFPHGQGPKLPLEDMGQQRVSKQARRLSHLALDLPCVERERAQISKALQRKFGPQDQVFPIRVWSAKGEPWLRRPRDSSMDVASAGLTGRKMSGTPRAAERQSSCGGGERCDELLSCHDL
jgi:hypothetical protein